MIHTLDTISLADFIELFNGNINKAGDGSDKDKLEASESMMSQYMQIVGGTQVKAEISKKNDSVNRDIRFNILNACDNFTKVGAWEQASALLLKMGFNIPSSDHDKIKGKILSIMSSLRLKISMAESKAREVKEMDEDYFSKERITVMSHSKMYIDPNVWRAKEYAYLVRQMNDEFKRMKGRH